jgi:hypothetical protein
VKRQHARCSLRLLIAADLSTTTFPKFPAPSTQARPSGCWQMSTSAGEMAMESTDDGVSLALWT